MITQRLLVFFVVGIIPALGATQHNLLLPRLQQVQYGSAEVLVRGLSVRVPSGATPEDRFAANTLSGCLSARSAGSVPVSESATADRVIELMRTGTVRALPVPGERPGPDSPEAYSLKVSQGAIEIRASSTAGLFYGAQTLCQMEEGDAAQAVLPEVEIHDWPSLAYRGTMIDMSHGPLPTENEVKRQLDFLARWKANQYYFYSEASIELKGYPPPNPGGRFTQDEVRRIVAYGRERHIDVVPCLELYGHLHDLFRVEKYADLADVPHGTEFDPAKPGVMPLLTDWANQFAELFPSRFVHIGFDETFQIEIASRQSGGAAAPAKLFTEQLSRVAGLFERHGKTVMAWGDIMVNYPQILSELPPGLICIAWEYKPGTSEHYQHRLGTLATHHVPHMIASGVTGWNQVSPDFLLSFANIDTFLAAGQKSGALGLINTFWTDDAQTLLRTSWPGMAYGAAAAWQSAPMDQDGFFPEYTRIAYSAKVAPEAAAALDDLARSEAELQKVLGEDTMLALWRNPFAPSTLKKSSENREGLRKARLLAEDAEEHLGRALSLGGDPVTLNSLLFGSRLLDYAAQKFHAPELNDMWRQLGPKRPKGEVWWNEWESQLVYQDHSRIVDLMDAITELRPMYRAEWLAEYTPYRLDSALGRWDAEYQYLRGLQERLQQFSDSSHEGDLLPPLEKVVGMN